MLSAYSIKYTKTIYVGKYGMYNLKTLDMFDKIIVRISFLLIFLVINIRIYSICKKMFVKSKLLETYPI